MVRKSMHWLCNVCDKLRATKRKMLFLKHTQRKFLFLLLNLDNCGEIWDFSKRIINVNFNNKGEGGKNAYHGIEIAIESGKGRSPWAIAGDAWWGGRGFRGCELKWEGCSSKQPLWRTRNRCQSILTDESASRLRCHPRKNCLPRRAKRSVLKRKLLAASKLAKPPS